MRGFKEEWKLFYKGKRGVFTTGKSLKNGAGKISK